MAAPDRACGTSHQSHRSSMTFAGGFRLAENDGMVGLFREHARSNLPAQIAIDTGVVHEEVARRIGWVTALRRGHAVYPVCISFRCSNSSRISRTTSSRWVEFNSPCM